MNKYNYQQIKSDYKTPPELINKALKIIGNKKFDLDVCCSDGDFPAEKYCVNGVIDGLSVEWEQTNWCNPPFENCSKWIKKAFEEQEKGKTTLMLLPVRTETKYWHDYILFNPFVEIFFLRKGYRFIDANTGEYLGVFKNALALVLFKAKQKYLW